jgi:hypothetical protein
MTGRYDSELQYYQYKCYYAINDGFEANLNVRQDIGQDFAPTSVDAARESLFR